ncbi:FAD-dependent oxidoreductase [Thiotrichales bacterium 19S3-7]|nr:FAD-dependent oxidoreductase [Thiotrichales bacterium 19S3-7]MCF6801748.1 FAD-dependent oxidoreductase [Thiotrichales bacterium 19S3-11]
MTEKTYLWCVIGGGPAGITAIGKLIDQGISVKSILWLSDHFDVGDIGLRWQEVPSNTKVSVFLNYLNSVKSFEFDQIQGQFPISLMDKNQCCHLGDVYQPLQRISNQLIDKVDAIECSVEGIVQQQNKWQINTTLDNVFYAEKVIFAQGAQANQLGYDNKILALEDVLNESKLSQLKTDKKVAVFGSSHSGILAIKNLLTYGFDVINFYRSPIRYALEMDNWILYDNTGLKGPVAQWARLNLHQSNQVHQQTSQCLRLLSDEATVNRYLVECDYVVYATGFHRRVITIDGYPFNHYCQRTGIIAPGVFGVGIAYPQLVQSPLGTLEGNVGLWKFSQYLDQVMPIWLQYG